MRTLRSDQWTQIRYEDLCTNTRETMDSVYSFLGLPQSRAYEDFRSVDHHIVGNGMRLDSSSEIVLDDRWRKVLTQDDLEVFDRVAGARNRQYGYS